MKVQKRHPFLSKKTIFGYFPLFLLFFALLPVTIFAQQKVESQPVFSSKWYIGVDGGISFGRGTLVSFGADKTRVGYGFGLLGGYHINSFLSTEAELHYSRLGLGAYDCCKDLWLGADGNRYYAPLAGVKNYRYDDIYSSVNLYSLGMRLNIDFLRMFNPNSRWSILLSPAVYGISSKAAIKTSEGKNMIIKGDNRMHFGVGGDLGVGYQICERVNLRLYTGMTYITGKGMDAMPQTEHKTNYTWDTGVKLTFALGKSTKGKKEKQVSSTVTAQPVQATEPVQQVVREEVQQLKTEQKAEVVTETKTPATPVQTVQPTQKVAYETAIYFSRGQCEYIEPSQYQTLVALLKALTASPDAQITIEGWADNTGTEAKNEHISARRAETMKRYLINKGIVEECISIKGNGVDTQATDDDKARRAEIRLIITEK